MHGEPGVARLRGVPTKHSTREPDPDNTGGGIATVIPKIPPERGIFSLSKVYLWTLDE
jgi:hypothetical protein